jgi:hypothetical protein
MFTILVCSIDKKIHWSKILKMFGKIHFFFVFVCLIIPITCTSLFGSSDFCFPFPNATVIGTQTLSFYTYLNVTRGDFMASSLLFPFRNTYAMGDGTTHIGTRNSTQAQNTVAVLARHGEALPCDYYVNVSTSTSITLRRGVACFTEVTSGSFQQVKNAVITFDSTIESNKTEYVIKFLFGFPVQVSQITPVWVGNASYCDVYWVAYSFTHIITSSPRDLYGNFISTSSFAQSGSTQSQVTYYGTVFSGLSFNLRGNSTVFIRECVAPPWPECNPSETSQLTWGLEDILSDIRYLAKRSFEVTVVPTYNTSIVVEGSIAEEIPHSTSPDSYTQWYVQGSQYSGETDADVISNANQQRTRIMDFIGRRACDQSVTITTLASATEPTNVTLYNETSCLTIVSGQSFYPLYILLDARDNPDAVFIVILYGADLLTPVFVNVTNGAKESNVFWLSAFPVKFTGFDTFENHLAGNYFFRNVTFTNSVVKINGSLSTVYTTFGDISSLTITSAGDLYGQVPFSSLEAEPDTNITCVLSNGTCVSGLLSSIPCDETGMVRYDNMTCAQYLASISTPQENSSALNSSNSSNSTTNSNFNSSCLYANGTCVNGIGYNVTCTEGGSQFYFNATCLPSVDPSTPPQLSSLSTSIVSGAIVSGVLVLGGMVLLTIFPPKSSRDSGTIEYRRVPMNV